MGDIGDGIQTSDVSENSSQYDMSQYDIVQKKKLSAVSMAAGRTLPTGICLSKSASGAGVLSMAAHAAGVGLTSS